MRVRVFEQFEQVKQNIMDMRQSQEVAKAAYAGLSAQKALAGTRLAELTRNLSAEEAAVAAISREQVTAREKLSGSSSAISQAESNQQGAISSKASLNASLVAVSGALVDWQKAYEVAINKKMICIGNLATAERNLDVQKKNYQTACREKEVFLKNLATGERNLAISQQNHATETRNMEIHEQNLKFYQHHIDTGLLAKRILLEKQQNIKAEDYYYYVQVATKHKTSFLGINAEPYYTYHDERRTDPAKFDAAKIEIAKTMEAVSKELEDHIAKKEQTLRKIEKTKIDLATSKAYIDSGYARAKAETLAAIKKTEEDIALYQAYIDSGYAKAKAETLAGLKMAEDHIALFKKNIENLSINKEEITKILQQVEKDIENAAKTKTDSLGEKNQVGVELARLDSEIAAKQELIRGLTAEKELTTRELGVIAEQERAVAENIAALQEQITTAEPQKAALQTAMEAELATAEGARAEEEAQLEQVIAGLAIIGEQAEQVLGLEQ